VVLFFNCFTANGLTSNGYLILDHEHSTGYETVVLDKEVNEKNNNGKEI